MTGEAVGDVAIPSTAAAATSAGLRSRAWRRFLCGPDSALLEDLYVPMLSAAARYDRSCAYFSSSVLAAASRGFAGLIGNLEALGDAAPRPAVRLVVNEELDPDDVKALVETGDTTRLEELLKRRFKTPQDALERARLQMLAWLAKSGLLEVRVGVMRQGGGIVHAKYGLAADQAGDVVVFAGSSNESAQGLRANYDQVEVSTSWEDPDRHAWYSRQFELLWTDKHPDVHTVSLPEAIRQRLLKLVPREAPKREPSNSLPRQRAAMLWRYIVEAPYLPTGEGACDGTALVSPWAHQCRVVADVAAAWPDGRLLCDEVGLGKTIEAILALRRLLAGRGVRRVLILPPAGLLKQWQGELREKGGLLFPRLDGPNRLVWPDGSVEQVENVAAALRRDRLLASRELLRLDQHRAAVLNAEPWDLVLLDEAHAARRRAQEEGEFNTGNLLLGLLRDLQLKRKARSLLLLSATPMQIQPWEPWDLLAALGEGGKWLAEFANVRSYYEAIARVATGHCDYPTAHHAAALVVADPEFPERPGVVGGVGVATAQAIAMRLLAVPPTERAKVAYWLRQGSPLSRRMHRNTRSTLRRYHELGLLPAPPPRRDIRDVQFDYDVQAERDVYQAVGTYIEKRFEELEREKPGKGFVMTVYRRRASSSPWALEQSLSRRSEGLDRVAQGYVVNQETEAEALEATELAEAATGDERIKVTAAYPDDPNVARAELREVNELLRQVRALGGQDSKLNRLYDHLRAVADEGRAVLVFTEYVDTLTYLRDKLQPHYHQALGCYSGDGGQRWDGKAWKAVTKDAITAALEKGELRVLLCTDAASEGLNLQAASALINYDLPWNPARVEQRIGRIDRIGQRSPNVRVVSLFLWESVDEKVYAALRTRCGLFEHFVGPMQPVLARARKMLLGGEPVDLAALDAEAKRIAQDAAAREAYVESDAEAVSTSPVPLTLADVEAALANLTGDFGPKARREAKGLRWTLTVPSLKRAKLSAHVAELERDPNILPLSPFAEPITELASRLTATGERLPLVVGSYQSGAFRCSVAYWVAGGAAQSVESFAQLKALVEAWDGSCPSDGEWVAALDKAQATAAAEVARRKQRADEHVEAGLRRQVEAARERLLWELGRYLACVDSGGDLNSTLARLIARDQSMSQRLQRAVERLTGRPDAYPTWLPAFVQELTVYAHRLNANQRQARLAGSELDAALNDPRWTAS